MRMSGSSSSSKIPEQVGFVFSFALEGATQKLHCAVMKVDRIYWMVLFPPLPPKSPSDECTQWIEYLDNPLFIVVYF